MSQIIVENFADFRKMEGQTLAPGPWITITQAMINAFAEATLDRQWIHVDEAKAAAQSPFKTTIAHGFMSVSMISKMLEDLVLIKSVSMGFNYGLNKVRFPHPVLVNSRLRLLSSIAKIEDYHGNGLKVFWNCTVAIEGAEKPACVGEFITLFFE